MADFEQVERFKGEWNGKEVNPKRVWSGHRFTDEECERLLAGEEIEITAVSSKTGKEFGCAGKLADLVFNDNAYVGFERTRFTDGGGSAAGPDGWCKYTFTDDEKKDLLAGKTVKGSDFIGKSGRKFKAEVKWNDKDKKIEVVEFLK